jgi:hypothetical protein
MSTEKDLTRLLKLCPEITLTFKDIQQIIDDGDFNACISKYKNGGVPVVVKEEVVEEVPIEEFDDDEELADHLVECEDETCECKGVFDQIEPENE